MANSDFLPFATGAGSNVVSPAVWNSAAARLTGFQAGVAESALVNTAIRQASFISAMIAKFILDQTASDVQDNGNLVSLENQFIDALNAAVGNVPAAALWHWGRDTGPVNALSVAAYPVVISYGEGLIVAAIPGHSNTIAAPTLNANGVGTATIYRADGTALIPGDIQANIPTIFVYDNTIPGWRIIGSPTIPQTGYCHFAVDTGSANAMVCTSVVPSIASVQSGMQFVIRKGAATNDGAVTLTIGGATAAVTWSDGSALTGKEWPAGADGIVVYDTTYRLLALPKPTVVGQTVVAIFTANGTYTPSATCTRVRVRGWAGGGPGANAPGLGGYAGGGGGGYFEAVIGVTPGVGIAVTVAQAVAAGTNGQPTSFGAYCTALGGTAASGNTPGVGGTAVGGQFNRPGRNGGKGFLTNGNDIFTGEGGASFSTSQTNYNQGGAANAQGAYPGGGGSSGNGGSGDHTGGNGAAGLVIVEELA